MNTHTFNPYRRMLIIIMAIALFITIVGMACDENPCANGSACGITSPVTSVEQTVIDAVNSTCPQRADGTCEVFGH